MLINGNSTLTGVEKCSKATRFKERKDVQNLHRVLWDLQAVINSPKPNPDIDFWWLLVSFGPPPLPQNPDLQLANHDLQPANQCKSRDLHWFANQKTTKARVLICRWFAGDLQWFAYVLPGFWLRAFRVTPPPWSDLLMFPLEYKKPSSDLRLICAWFARPYGGLRAHST